MDAKTNTILVWGHPFICKSKKLQELIVGKKGGNLLPTIAVRWHHMFSVTSLLFFFFFVRLPQRLPRSLLLEGNRESILEAVMCAALLSRFAVAVMLRYSATGIDAGPTGCPLLFGFFRLDGRRPSC